MEAAGPQRARGALVALEAALVLDEEDGDVPARILVEHLMDTRRRQKLLLAQLRVLRRLLGVLENPGPPPGPPQNLREEGAAAREHWRGLKAEYGGALAAIGGALPPALAHLRRGRRLQKSLQGGLRQHSALQTKLHEAAGKRDQLLQRVRERREELARLRGAGLRVGAGCRLYQLLAGVRVLPPPRRDPALPPSPELELELGSPSGPPEDLPPLRLRCRPGGELRVVGPAPCWPRPLGPGLPDVAEGRPLAAELQRLQCRFALDWDPARGLLRVLGPGTSGTLWTLEVEPGYPRQGQGVRLLPPPTGVCVPPPPSAAPTLTQWLELLLGTPQEPPK